MHVGEPYRRSWCQRVQPASDLELLERSENLIEREKKSPVLRVRDRRSRVSEKCTSKLCISIVPLESMEVRHSERDSRFRKRRIEFETFLGSGARACFNRSSRHAGEIRKELERFCECRVCAS